MTTRGRLDIHTLWQTSHQPILQQPMNTLRGGEKKDFGEPHDNNSGGLPVKGGGLKEGMKAS